jgi:hypothetical protein
VSVPSVEISHTCPDCGQQTRWRISEVGGVREFEHLEGVPSSFSCEHWRDVHTAVSLLADKQLPDPEDEDADAFGLEEFENALGEVVFAAVGARDNRPTSKQLEDLAHRVRVTVEGWQRDHGRPDPLADGSDA